MSIEIRIQARRTEGALVRIMRFIERRGFDLRDVRATHESDDALALEIETDTGQVSASTLERQLDNLYDVLTARCRMPAHAPATATVATQELRA